MTCGGEHGTNGSHFPVFNQIGDDGIMAIKASLNNSSITLLDVIGCGIGVVGARLITYTLFARTM